MPEEGLGMCPAPSHSVCIQMLSLPFSAERGCVWGGVGESVLSRKHRDAYQSLCLAGTTDTLPFYPITMQAFPVRPGSRTLYNIDGVLSHNNNARLWTTQEIIELLGDSFSHCQEPHADGQFWSWCLRLPATSLSLTNPQTRVAILYCTHNETDLGIPKVGNSLAFPWWSLQMLSPSKAQGASLDFAAFSFWIFLWTHFLPTLLVD